MATTQLTASGVLNELVGAARLEKISVTCRLDPGDLTINGKSAIKPTFDTNNGDVALLRIWPKGDTTSVTELTLTNSQYADFENNNEYLIPNLIAGTTYKVSLFIMYNSDIVDANDNTTVLDQAPVGFEKTTEVMPYTVANIKSGTTSDSSTGLDNFFTTGALDSIMLKLPGSFDNYFTDKTVYNGYDPLTSITVLLVDSASDSGDNTIVNTYGKDDLKDGITSPNLQFTISDDVEMSTDYEIFITVTNSATAENGAAITSVGSVSTKIASNPASVTVDKVSGNNGDLTISFQIANELLNGRSATYSLTDSDLYSVNTTFEIYGTENYTDTMDTILNNPLFTTVVKHPTEPSGTEPNLALSDNNDPDSITISFSNTNQASVVLGGNSGASASEKKNSYIF